MALRTTLAAIAGAVLAPTVVLAEPRPGTATAVEGVVVAPSDKALNELAHDYVSGIVARKPQRSLVRWRRPICPLVAGLPQDKGEYVLARLSEVAREANAPLGAPNCRANLYVVVSDEPQRLLALWSQHDHHLFGSGLPAVVARFVATDKPVRVWHNWILEQADGRAAPPESSSYNGAPTLRFSKASRLTENAVRNAGSVLVVVDERQIEGVTVVQLADYIAMAAFTELRSRPQPGGAPTILALFENGGEPPPGLSDWDRAFLRGLYGTNPESVTQRVEIAGRVLRNIRQAETAR